MNFIISSIVLLFYFLTVYCQVYKDELLEFLGRQHFQQIFQDGNESIEYELVFPNQADHNGNHIERYRRHLRHPDEMFYTFRAFGDIFHLHLKKNNDVASSSLKYISREGNSTSTMDSSYASNCFYHGSLLSHGNTPVAMSTCDGLNGLIRTPSGDFIIQFLPLSIKKKRSIEDHVVYKRPASSKFICSAGKYSSSKKFSFTPTSKAFRGSLNALQTKLLTIETAVFMDFQLYQHMRRIFTWKTDESILVFLLSIVNAMQLIYNDGSLSDKKVQFIVIKVDIFKTRQVGFEVTPSAATYLNSFCQWQETVNVPDDKHPDHWDHALIFTGLDLVYEGNTACAGLAPIGGMCSMKASCTLSEGKGFLTVFIAAHESGHTFGIRHDGEGNRCEDNKFIMAPEGLKSLNPWSSCSNNYFQDYLKKPISVCLLDTRKPTENLNHERDNNVLLGQKYDADAQCQVEHGLAFLRDRSQKLTQICKGLACNDGFTSLVGLPVFEGTACGPDFWCRKKQCVKKVHNDEIPPSGHWSEYSEHSKCNAPCIVGGTGIAIWEKHCLHPWGSEYLAQCSGHRLIFDLCGDRLICTTRRTIPDIASEICQMLSKSLSIPFQEGGRQNIDDESGGCRVWCLNFKNEYQSWKTPFPDGTPCGQKKYCIRGKCADFSCGSSVEDPEKSSCFQDSVKG